jgi:hypothetical protein
MASSKLFIGGEFPLSLSISLSFLLHSSIRFRLFRFVSLSLRESLKTKAERRSSNWRSSLPGTRPRSFYKYFTCALFFNVWKHQAERARSCIEQKKNDFFPIELYR